MKHLKYIELKTGYSNNGPAWIALVETSKSGETVYFEGKALKKARGSGILGNFFDAETGDEYWISGVKKQANNRLKSSISKIMLDMNAVEALRTHIEPKSLNLNRYELVALLPTDKTALHSIENEPLL